MPTTRLASKYSSRRNKQKSKQSNPTSSSSSCSTTPSSSSSLTPKASFTNLSQISTFSNQLSQPPPSSSSPPLSPTSPASSSSPSTSPTLSTDESDTSSAPSSTSSSCLSLDDDPELFAKLNKAATEIAFSHHKLPVPLTNTTNFLSSALSTTLSPTTIASATTNAAAIPSLSSQNSCTSLSTLTPTTPSSFSPMATPQATSLADVSVLSQSTCSSNSNSNNNITNIQSTPPPPQPYSPPSPHTTNVIRKKSGERVKSSLKLPSLVRPKSMPSTPSKAVHFDANLERVCHFLHSERPTAVSATSSPADERAEFHWATDSESDSSGDEEDEEENLRSGFQRYMSRSEWSIALSNFPNLLIDEMMPKMVFMETLFLSSDKQSLVGHVAVRNIDYQKTVCVRYTIDHWQTFTEVQADFNDDVRRKRRLNGFDRFTFAIRLSTLPYLTLSTKSMFMCVRYFTAGQEFWDNNNSLNYQVDFSRVPRTKENNRVAANSANNSMARLGRHHRRSRSGSSISSGGLGNFSFDGRGNGGVPNNFTGSGPVSEEGFSSRRSSASEVEGVLPIERNPKLDSDFNKDFDHVKMVGSSVDDLFDDLTAPRFKSSKEQKSQFTTRYSFGASFNASKQQQQQQSRNAPSTTLTHNTNSKTNNINTNVIAPSSKSNDFKLKPSFTFNDKEGSCDSSSSESDEYSLNKGMMRKNGGVNIVQSKPLHQYQHQYQQQAQPQPHQSIHQPLQQRDPSTFSTHKLALNATSYQDLIKNYCFFQGSNGTPVASKGLTAPGSDSESSSSTVTEDGNKEMSKINHNPNNTNNDNNNNTSNNTLPLGTQANREWQKQLSV